MNKWSPEYVAVVTVLAPAINLTYIDNPDGIIWVREMWDQIIRKILQ